VTAREAKLPTLGMVVVVVVVVVVVMMMMMVVVVVVVVVDVILRAGPDSTTAVWPSVCLYLRVYSRIKEGPPPICPRRSGDDCFLALGFRDSGIQGCGVWGMVIGVLVQADGPRCSISCQQKILDRRSQPEMTGRRHARPRTGPKLGTGILSQVA
jgi:hypothetical protein